MKTPILSPRPFDYTFKAPMAIIPMDVLYSCILPRLPVKTLTRFKSVSKSWRTIISSREFIHIHHHKALSSDANRLNVFVDLASQKFRIHKLDSPLSPPVHWYNPEPSSISMSILASCEFFLLIDFRVNLRLVLLNPSTGRYYQIPYPPSEGRAVRYGMYLDDANNDYKVVIIKQKGCLSYSFEEPRRMTMEVMVYSRITNKWRLIEQTMQTIQENGYAWCSVVIGHILHILFAPKYMNTIKRIGCFDIRAEKWTTDVPMPEKIFHEWIKLAVLDGLLCVITKDSMWVMKEYGVKDSWFKLMSVTSDDDILYWPHSSPIYFRKGSQDEVLRLKYENSKLEYIWFNVREKKATTATFNGVLPTATINAVLPTILDGNYGFICKESLVDFPGGRNLKLHQPKQRGRN